MAARSDEHKRSPLKAWMRALERTAAIGRDPAVTLPVVISRLAERFGDAPALAGGGSELSYRELGAACNRYAHWGLAQGLSGGDVVALFMANHPHYLPIWLGLTGIGVSVALVNTNLTGALLAHSLNLVQPRYVVAGGSLAAALEAVRPQLGAHVGCWMSGAGAAALPRLDLAAAQLPEQAPPPASFRAPTLSERALCIYTSGTTGLPKAANVSHLRLMQWSHWFAGLIDVRPADRMYNCLPLYHSVGGVVAAGATLVGGGTLVLRERFSASTFWQDVTSERCTLFQYIGELCRYLLNSPPHPQERRHTLRLACGNGLRADVWTEFQQRFGVPEILEYYASTEGNFSLYNCEGRVGAIGRIPPFLAHRVPVALVRYDVGAEAPLRDASGRCERCGPNEAGEALGQILATSGATHFEGYTDPAASARKVLRDVFEPGDAWYRTGDLMRQDAQGFFYFVDRVGDTFRWKGENVSTTEVAGVIAACPHVIDAAVYGVVVPNSDGRAGMAALTVSGEFALPELRRHLAAALPAYARPLFIRIVGALELTGTFKQRKQQLALEGYDVARVADPLYLDDAAAGEYRPLDAALHRRLVAGELRL
jgi:fatty-acyl-CoA synthase